MVHFIIVGGDVYRNDGQVSWEKVLVYRNPGLHFGDIHVLKAIYVKDLEDIIGNSKYAIFFPCSGPRSLADEIAKGDFDGDMYFVSRNAEVCLWLSWHICLCNYLFLPEENYLSLHFVIETSSLNLLFESSIF